MAKKEIKELTPRDENYSQWYQDIVVKAGRLRHKLRLQHRLRLRQETIPPDMGTTEDQP